MNNFLQSVFLPQSSSFTQVLQNCFKYWKGLNVYNALNTVCTLNKIPVKFRTYWNQRLWKILWMNRNFIQSKWHYFSAIYTTLSIWINYINFLIVLSAITVPLSILKICMTSISLSKSLTQLNLGLCAPWSNYRNTILSTQVTPKFLLYRKTEPFRDQIYGSI